jgi:hypothetical protein
MALRPSRRTREASGGRSLVRDTRYYLVALFAVDAKRRARAIRTPREVTPEGFVAPARNHRTPLLLWLHIHHREGRDRLREIFCSQYPRNPRRSSGARSCLEADQAGLPQRGHAGGQVGAVASSGDLWPESTEAACSIKATERP